MKRIAKIFLCVLMVLSVLIILPDSVNAASLESHDGLEVSILTDKDEYSQSDDIKITINVKNTNAYDMENISVDALLPEGLTVKSGELSNNSVNIKAGETYTVSIEAKLTAASIESNNSNLTQATNNTGAAKDTAAAPVKTGDSTNIVLWIVVLAISVAGVIVAVKGKKSKKALSMFLVMALILTGTLTGISGKVLGANKTGSISVDKTITVNGQQYTVKGVVSYEKQVKEDETSYTVVFNSNGGSDIASQTVKKGSTVTKPDDPNKDGSIFAGWYTDNVTFEYEFDFATAIDKDYTLYAKWITINGDSDPGTISGSGSSVDSYSITALDVALEANTATATVSAPENCAVVVRFIDEEVYFAAEYPANKKYINNGEIFASHVVAAGADMKDVTASITGESGLPAYFVAEAVLVDGEGNQLCDPYTSLEHTNRHQLFEEKTIDSFDDDDTVLNFDDDTDNNFGVLADDVKVLTADKVDYDRESGTYQIKSPSETIAVGDKIFISDEDGSYIFRVKTVSEEGGVVNVLQARADDETLGFTLQNFYKYLKVDMEYTGDVETEGTTEAAEEETIEEEETTEAEEETTKAEETAEVTETAETTESSDGLVTSSSVSKQYMSLLRSVTPKAETGISVSPIAFETEHFKADGKITGTLSAELEIEFDIAIFGENYFKNNFKYTMDVSTAIKMIAKTDNDDEKEVDEREITLGKIVIPFGVTGLDAFVDMKAKFQYELTAGLEMKGKIKSTYGYLKNSKDGLQKIGKSEAEWSVDLSGKAEFKFGPASSVGIEFLAGVLKAQLECFMGGKLEGEAVIPLSETGSSRHICNLCIDGKMSLAVNVDAKMSYKLTEHLKSTPIDWKIAEHELKLFDFYVSLVNPVDSRFGGHKRMGIGSCTNKEYLVTVNAKDANNHDVSVGVKIYNQDTGAFKTSLTSGGSVYLPSANYTAKATIDGVSYEKTFTVNDAPKTVTIYADNLESKINGSVVDAETKAAISGATISVYDNTTFIASTTSDASGKYELPLDSGVYKLVISADDYVPAERTFELRNGENKYFDSLLMAKDDEDEIMGGIYGTINDGVTGRPVSDVDIKISRGWGNESATDYVVEKKTDSNGDYAYKKWQVSGVNFGLDAGNYTVTISKEGYISTTFNITIVGGIDLEFNSTITPVGDEEAYRVVLTWGYTPEDLDSHLNATLGISNDHIYYRRMTGSGSNLDVDDTTSYGPETITIPDISVYSGKVMYSVHDYTNRDSDTSSEMSNSGAVVKVYKGGTLLETFYIPAGVAGTVWNVFYFDEAHNIVPVNTFEFVTDPDAVVGSTGH